MIASSSYLFSIRPTTPHPHRPTPKPVRLSVKGTLRRPRIYERAFLPDPAQTRLVLCIGSNQACMNDHRLPVVPHQPAACGPPPCGRNRHHPTRRHPLLPVPQNSKPCRVPTRPACTSPCAMALKTRPRGFASIPWAPRFSLPRGCHSLTPSCCGRGPFASAPPGSTPQTRSTRHGLVSASISAASLIGAPNTRLPTPSKPHGLGSASGPAPRGARAPNSTLTSGAGYAGWNPTHGPKPSSSPPAMHRPGITPACTKGRDP